MSEQSLARTGRADQQNIRFTQFDVAWLLVQENPLVVVVNRNRQFLLRAILSDYVSVQKLLDLGRAGKPLRWGRGLFALFVFQNGFANADALITYIGARVVRRRADQLLDLLLRFMAEGTPQRFVGVVLLFHGVKASAPPSLRWSTSSSF